MVFCLFILFIEGWSLGNCLRPVYRGICFSVDMWEYLLNNYLDIGQLKSDGFLLLVWFGGEGLTLYVR